MYKYIFQRMLSLIVVMLGISIIVFTMIYLTPGDAARMMFGVSAPPDALEALREQMGLNDHFLVQYGRWLRNLVFHLDLGKSHISEQPVLRSVLEVFPNTLKLATAGIFVSIAFGVPTGIISATKQYSFADNASMFVALLGLSMPYFWLGMSLILIFSLNLRWLPFGGLDNWTGLILPAITMASGGVTPIILCNPRKRR
jgi:peptide/nickel transport system permease protein